MKKDGVNKWSPFSPEWYKLAFDKYTSTSEQLLNKSEIMSMGFSLPDADGSRSSVFRDEAVLNNSFNEMALRDTLKDIYLSTSHKMMASNHDNVHFFKYNTTMLSDEISINIAKKVAEISIPSETFIRHDLRNKYKLNRFYKRWIKSSEILNNWEIFHWMCLMFIDGRVAYDYELMMDDRQTIIKFPYEDSWVENNSKIMITKFDTLYQRRVSTSRHEIFDKWNMKMPVERCSGLKDYDMVAVFFNRFSDNERNDDKEGVVTVAGSIDFLPIKDGYLDLSKMSILNKNIINSERKHSIYMTFVIPKYMYEYPILLPYDTVYRSYVPDLVPVFVSQYGDNAYVGTDNKGSQATVYVDLDTNTEKFTGGWKSTIRPIVLSDTYLDENQDVYGTIYDELVPVNNVGRDVTAKMNEIVSRLPMLYNGDVAMLTDEEVYAKFPKAEFAEDITELIQLMSTMNKIYLQFLSDNTIATDEEYSELYNEFISKANALIEAGPTDKSLYAQFMKGKSFWDCVANLINEPKRLYERVVIGSYLKGIDREGVWGLDKKYLGERRFIRPIDISDFLIMEYDKTLTSWTPVDATLEYHFPDVYIITKVDGEEVSGNRIFKALFFYSDNPNPRNKSTSIIQPSPQWDIDTEAFELTTERQLQDIFIEKFYWAGIRMVYQGVLKTKYRWELLEYVMDNPSYARFNNLFLNTMEEYFKLGMATFVSGNNAYFPFDDAISKMNENLDQRFLGYAQVNNFERYLKKTFIPSYFDYIERIDHEKDWSASVLRRPNSSFAIDKITSIFGTMNTDIFDSIPSTIESLDYFLDYMSDKGMISEQIKNLINKLNDIIQKINKSGSEFYEFLVNLDMDIYSFEDLIKINEYIDAHNSLTSEYEDYVDKINALIEKHKAQESIEGIIEEIRCNVDDNIATAVENILSIESFDIDKFMKVVSNPEYFGKISSKDDHSLIGIINQFRVSWNNDVLDLRDKLFKETLSFYNTFKKGYSYTTGNEDEFSGCISDMINTIEKLYTTTKNWCTKIKSEYDSELDEVFKNTLDMLKRYADNIKLYFENMSVIDAEIDLFNDFISNSHKDDIVEYDVDFEKELIEMLNSLRERISNICNMGNYDDSISTDDIDKLLEKWVEYIHNEEILFDELAERLGPSNNDLITVFDSYKVPISAITSYINNSLEEYIPDKTPVTHSKIYQIETVGVESGGFNYSTDDNIYIPNVGVYKATEISDDDIKSLVNLEKTKYPCTTFRDPCNQYGAYDTISSGKGICTTINALSSSSATLINDEIVLPYINKVENFIILIDRMEKTFNLSRNPAIDTILVNAKNIVEYWNNILENYSDNLSTEVKNKADEILELLKDDSNLITILNSIISHRNEIDMSFILECIGNIRNITYTYYHEKDKIDKRFNYFDENLANAAVTLSSWYNYGYEGIYESYRDGFIRDINSLSSYLRAYESQIINFIEEGNEKDEVNNLVKKFHILVDRINIILGSGEDSLDNDYTELDKELSSMEQVVDISDIDLRVDEWYEIAHLSAIKEGNGYRVGDVVRIQSKEMDDDTYEDVNDSRTLFAVIKQVNSIGGVIRVEPLIQYALSEDLSGEYTTKTEFGSGEGLNIKIYSTVITADTITADMASTIDQYNDNDMIVFNFGNSRDLDIRYDVFIKGLEQAYPVVRHNDIMPNGSGGHDSIYVNANILMSLADSSIIKMDENYFTYKLDKITVLDGGAGYAPGQIIYADANNIPVKMEVGEVEYPLGTIKTVNIIPDAMMFNGVNPECDDCPIIDDNFSNIDDEFNDGFDNTLNRNMNYMHSSISDSEGYGIGLDHVYPGRQYGDEWFDRVTSILPNMDPLSTPQNPEGYEGRREYQFIEAVHIHRSNDKFVLPEYDISVATSDDLPKTSNEWKEAAAKIGIETEPTIGAYVHVENDATMNGHNTKYKVRNFSTTGYILYNAAEFDDVNWTTFTMLWNSMDSTPGTPGVKERYPDIPYMDADSYSSIEKAISSKEYKEELDITTKDKTYIHDMNDTSSMAVFNYTTKRWEDLSDPKWVFAKTHDAEGKETGFTLTYNQDGEFSYEMWFYIIKDKANQVKSALSKNARVSIEASIYRETSSMARVIPINTGRDIRIRKTFPYDHTFNFTISEDNKIMNCKFDRYIHYKNELHLEDIIIKNEAGEFMDVMDSNLFEVQFRDPRAVGNGTGSEIQTYISNLVITNNHGKGFVDGRVWGYNEEFDTYIFGSVTSDLTHPLDESTPIGAITSVKIDHFINPPKYVNIDNVMAGGESTSLTFNLYQGAVTGISSSAVITVTFTTKNITELSGSTQIHRDGYIHNVTNPLAPLPREFRILYKGNVISDFKMEVIIDKNYKEWSFIKEDSMMFPEIRIDGEWLVSDRIYITTMNGRLPLINPSTQRPSFTLTHDRNGTTIRVLISYSKYERVTIHYVPYPMRSVYTSKRIDPSGYVNLKGKINKPLNKKYFEFWMNGRLLTDEISIISPTKIFFHGLKSLRNFEIVEINRDPNEYFSDIFIDKFDNGYGVINPRWNFRTYLDDALEGTLEDDNYSLDEQRSMLYPVWEQVPENDEKYKDYPENEDSETDIMLYVDEFDLSYLDTDLPTAYQYLVTDIPTIGETEISSDTVTCEQIGFIPMTADDVMDIIKEEWADEIATGKIPSPTVIKETEWYGIGVIMYDEYGNLTSIPENVVFMVMDDKIVHIDEDTSSSKVIPKTVEYNLE